MTGWPPGTQLTATSGRCYTLTDQRRVGGGHSEIWAANDALNDAWLVKVALPGMERELQAERDILRQLNLVGGPLFVRLKDEGTHDGRPYLVLREFPEDLAAWLARGQPLAKRLDALIQVATAVDGFRRSGQGATAWVHRDLKLGNFLVRDKPGRPLELALADFGLAREVDDVAGNTGRGTPGYMSWDAMVHRARVSPATDMFALGVIALRLLTGDPRVGPKPHGPHLTDAGRELLTLTHAVSSRALSPREHGRLQTLSRAPKHDLIDVAALTPPVDPQPAAALVVKLRADGASDAHGAALCAAVWALLDVDPDKRPTHTEPLTLTLRATHQGLAPQRPPPHVQAQIGVVPPLGAFHPHEPSRPREESGRDLRRGVADLQRRRRRRIGAAVTLGVMVVIALAWHALGDGPDKSDTRPTPPAEAPPGPSPRPGEPAYVPQVPTPAAY